MDDADSDAQAMLRVAAGDRRAFARLFDRHHASVARFAFRFVGNRERAEELTQDIFVKLYRNARAYQPTARFKTFLFRVATNHCLNEVRRGEYRTPRASAAAPDGDDRDGWDREGPQGDRPDAALEGRELERAVGEALADMSARERAAFTMCRFEGMAYRDIADALEASESAVKSLIHRATLAVARRIEALQTGTVPARSRA
ncbi:RNA polymerase sigma factor [Corallococcus macrosporus]|uniref:DNA-directed RNA polymerase sigma-70 factor n=2 Tax=Myxococcaceae TaxID=31 RepID=A0A250JQ58_9BACT|nr:sigma-70 family RNA polymerase sigma factor [Corallococcus macrosporus]AEI62295.1 RNA polymerase sigma-70 factor [Corallococcus macrosporus]ATB45798.1 DNA-directed RNA polymerase sigma-70 factor [Corallococcus macrosporus DSM 14697]